MADETPKIELGTVIAGRYRVERRLGEGGMGSVFLVQHLHTEQHLALKVLRSTIVKDAVALERFRREARAPARIQSDHVVVVTDADVAPELGGLPFLVMEWLRGENLEQLSSRGPLPSAEVVLYLRHTARALDKAHALGIVHRDLKPENLFLTTREDGTPWIKLLDFGIAKLTGVPSEIARAGSATSTGQIFGTPLYMSPEQAKGEAGKISPQSDIWALGLMAHKLLTGKEIWTADTLVHLVAQIAYEPLPIPSEHGATFGPAYDAWFLRACARNPEERFKSAGEAVTALAEALSVNENSIRISHGDIKSSPLSSAKSASAAALAETAFDTSTGPVAGTSINTSPPGSAREKQPSQPSRVPLIAGALSLIALLSLGIGLLLGRGNGTSKPVEPDSSAPSAPRPTDPMVFTAPPPAESNQPLPALTPTPETPSVPPISSQAKPTKPSAAPIPSKTPSARPSVETPPQPTATASQKPVPTAPDDPLGTRH